MKEIVVLSGKGGTGKTSITAAWSFLGGSDIVVADCDVDAADMHLLLQPDWAKEETFSSGYKAVINDENCVACGKCKEICRFKAVSEKNRQYSVNELDCEGCGYCYHVCPARAIELIEPIVGNWYVSRTKADNYMVHARLKSGADNSGKLVAKVKKEARNLAEKFKKDIVLVDGSPGIGCPVVSSLSGASSVCLITEPTVSGFHDLIRITELVKNFKLPLSCIINKSDINPEQTGKIRDFLAQEEITHLASLPYDETFTKTMVRGKTILESDRNELKNIIKDTWEQIKSLQE